MNGNCCFDWKNVQSFRFFTENLKMKTPWIVIEEQLVGFWV